MSKRIQTFPVGTVTNNARVTRSILQPNKDSVTIKYPARLEAMALDPAKIATNESLVYTAGQIDVCVAIYKTVTVKIIADSSEDVIISARTARKPLVRHAALLMKRALNISSTLSLDIEDELPLRHCGLGSSSGTIAAVASAINELFSRPIAKHDLVLYCAQNHGEEIDDDDNMLVAVQCIGGSAVCGNYEGGLIVLAGEATPIAATNLPEKYKVVIGVPAEFSHPDSKLLMQQEEDNMAGFLSTGNEYGSNIAYRLIHECLPELALGKLQSTKRLVFDYRWDMGSIKNCSFVLPRINEIAESLRAFQHDSSVALLALSSVGPGFFAITDNPEGVAKAFKQLQMDTYTVEVHNNTYTVA